MIPQAHEAYEALNTYILAHYPNMETQTAGPSKYGKTMLRYRRSGRSFCTFYEQEETFLLLIVLGAKERAKFEADLSRFSPAIVQRYLDAPTYHDGKWIYFPIADPADLPDLYAILAIKRKPQQDT